MEFLDVYYLVIDVICNSVEIFKYFCKKILKNGVV